MQAAFELSEEQTDAILELRLYRLAKLEILMIRKEAEEKRSEAKGLRALLKSRAKLLGLVKSELKAVADEFADRRRTRIVAPDEEPEFSETDFIIDEDAYVIVTARGWVKRQQTVRDLASTRVKDGDRVLACLAGSTRASAAFFTNLGLCYVVRIADLPASTGYGDPLQKLFKFADGERVVGAASLDPRQLVIPDEEEVFEDGTPCPPYGVAVTKGGLALRFPLFNHREPSTRSGRKYARLKEGDEVETVFVQTEDTEGYVLAATTDGHGIAVDIEELAVLSGPGRGTQLIKLAAGSEVLAARHVPSERKGSLVVKTEKGRRFELFAESLAATRASRGKAIVKRSRFAEVEYELPPVPDLPSPEES
jgi:DNA gyrase subunit A